MSNYWGEYWRRVEQWQAAGDSEQLRLQQLWEEAIRYRETDPDRGFALLTQARDEAIRLDESWWVLFLEHWRLTSLTGDAADFTRALPLAMDLMVQISLPAGRNHESRVGILTDVLTTYIGSDPLGFRDEIERGLVHLDGIIPRAPVSDRYVLQYRWAEYLGATERWEEADDLTQRSLALADHPRNQDRVWWRAWFLFLLCESCDAQGKRDVLADHADALAEVSRHYPNLRRTEAAGRCWRAVADRAAGREQQAAQSIHKGIRLLRDLSTRNITCAEPMARYYELAGDLRAAIGVRERAITDLERKGQFHRACQMHVERCRLLAQMGSLTPTDLEKARWVATRLRVPQWFLTKLDRIRVPPDQSDGAKGE